MLEGARLLRLCILAFAVFATALFSHVAIDALGDRVLARDAYDFVPHGSRSIVLAAALALLAAGGARLALLTIRAAGGGRALAAHVHKTLPGHPVLLACGVAAASLPLLAGMEAIDVAGSGAAIDDLADLLAGAPIFSCCVLSVVALAVTFAIRLGARLLTLWADALVRAVCAFLRLVRGAAFSAGNPAARERPVARRSSVLARCAGLRAPPRSTRLPG